MPRRVMWLVLVAVVIPAVLTGGSPGCEIGGSSESTPGGQAAPTAEGPFKTEDPLTSSTGDGAFEGSPETDREALVALANAAGNSSQGFSNWGSNLPLEMWAGVWTDDNGRVRGLSLTGLGAMGEGLRGELPAELGNLSMLETLRLDQHLLSGEIPPELGRLSNLDLLSLRDNRLSGPIPRELGNLANLRVLNLSYNRLGGEIPAELGNLSGLEWLSLNWNQLSGEIPSQLWDLTNTHLGLGSNQGSFCVPEDQLARRQSDSGDLVDLLVCGHPNLATATPAPTRPHRSTPGPAATATPYPTLSPDAIMDREALVALYNATGGDHWHFKQNWLSDLPLFMWDGVETDDEGRVVALNLIGNNLSGEIPSELGSLENLVVLDLSRNQLSGMIPPELGNLSSLAWLALYWNNLSGEIPAGLGGLSNLRMLDLSRNELSGEIPSELGNLSMLRSLYLIYNNLSGDVPPQLGDLSNLKELRIDGAYALSGCIPAALESQLDMGRSDLQDVPFC